jgi:hypothetical protein
MIGVLTGKDREGRVASVVGVIGSGVAAGKKAVKLAFVLFLVVGVLSLLVRGRRGGDAKSAPRTPSQPDESGDSEAGPYRSVSINTGESPCGGARTLAGQRYLLGNAPMLPLADCDAECCDCRYVHHADRRDRGGDRRLMHGLQSQLYSAGGEERRVAGDRRGDDLAAELPGSNARESEERANNVPVTEAVVAPTAEPKKTGAAAPVQ